MNHMVHSQHPAPSWIDRIATDPLLQLELGRIVTSIR
ncbi:hypothetical protein BH24ACT7_BH24ACT7_05060 [soil metagenome]